MWPLTTAFFMPLQVDFSRVVFEGARVMAANRLATSGMEWADTFKRENR